MSAEERLRSEHVSKGWGKDKLRAELVKALDILNIHQDREEECVAMLKQALKEIQGLKKVQVTMNKEIQDLKAENGTFKQQLSEASEESKKIVPHMNTVTE